MEAISRAVDGVYHTRAWALLRSVMFALTTIFHVFFFMIHRCSSPSALDQRSSFNRRDPRPPDAHTASSSSSSSLLLFLNNNQVYARILPPFGTILGGPIDRCVSHSALTNNHLHRRPLPPPSSRPTYRLLFPFLLHKMYPGTRCFIRAVIFFSSCV